MSDRVDLSKVLHELNEAISPKQFDQLKLAAECLGVNQRDLDDVEDITDIFRYLADTSKGAISLLHILLTELKVSPNTTKLLPTTTESLEKCSLRIDLGFAIMVVGICNDMDSESFKKFANLSVAYFPSQISKSQYPTVEKLFQLLFRKRIVWVDNIKCLETVLQDMGKKDSLEKVETYQRLVGTQEQDTEQGTATQLSQEGPSQTLDPRFSKAVESTEKDQSTIDTSALVAKPTDPIGSRVTGLDALVVGNQGSQKVDLDSLTESGVQTVQDRNSSQSGGSHTDQTAPADSQGYPASRYPQAFSDDTSSVGPLSSLQPLHQHTQPIQSSTPDCSQKQTSPNSLPPKTNPEARDSGIGASLPAGYSEVAHTTLQLSVQPNYNETQAQKTQSSPKSPPPETNLNPAHTTLQLSENPGTFSDSPKQKSPKSRVKTNPTARDSGIADSVRTLSSDTSIWHSGPTAQTQSPVGAGNEISTSSMGSIDYPTNECDESAPLTGSKKSKFEWRKIIIKILLCLLVVFGILIIFLSLIISFGVCLTSHLAGISTNSVNVTKLSHEHDMVIVGTVDASWYLNVSVEEVPKRGDTSHENNIFVTTGLKKHNTTNHKQYPVLYQSTSSRKTGILSFKYLLDGSSIDYTICLTYRTTGVMDDSSVYVFNHYDRFQDFQNGVPESESHAICSRKLAVGTFNKSVCTPLHCSIKTPAFHFIAAKTGGDIYYNFTYTIEKFYIQYTDYDQKCTVFEGRPCSLTLPEGKVYYILAYTVPSESEEPTITHISLKTNSPSESATHRVLVYTSLLIVFGVCLCLSIVLFVAIFFVVVRKYVKERSHCRELVGLCKQKL